MPWLGIAAALALAAGLGMRDPMPPDEPRFALAAQTMVESGAWLFPHRGAELYADKPPLFMWLQAGAYRAVGDWQVAFLLPSLLAALATLWLVHDASRRLWGRRVANHAAAALFVCLQFGLQAKRAQIDMVLVAFTTLALWAFLRALFERADARWIALGAFAAGLGTITKGVGFLALLVFLPAWIAYRRRPSALAGRLGARHALAGVAGFVAGVGVWLVPMLVAVRASGDPALAAYANEILFKQTGTRYANAWDHVKPSWYYLQAMAMLWLPGVLLLPWLVPAWSRRIARGDARQTVLLGWALVVLAFFTLATGKREVYIFPALPALCLAAAPLLPGLLRRAPVRFTLAGYVGVLALASLVIAALLLAGGGTGLQAKLAQRGLEVADLRGLAVWLVAFAAVVAAIALLRLRARVGPTLVLATAALWTAYGVGVMPALEGDGSARELMQEVRARIGPDAELALLGWREQHLLQAGPGTVEFGFKRAWHEQWAEAGPWLARAPERRWLFVLEEAMGPCVDRDRASFAGHSNRRAWWLVPGPAWRAGCVTPAFSSEDKRGD